MKNLIVAAMALLLTTGCFEGPTGPAGQDAVIDSWSWSGNPTQGQSVSMPSWSTNANVLVVVEMYLTGDGGWVPLSILWSYAADPDAWYQSYAVVNGTSVRIWNTGGAQVRIHAYHFASGS